MIGRKRAPKLSHSSFEEAFAAGLDSVLIYHVIAAKGLRARVGFRRWFASFLLAFAWCACLPFFFLGVGMIASPYIFASAQALLVGRSILGLCVVCVLNLISVVWGAFSWALLSRRASWLDEMIDDESRHSLIDYIDRTIQRPYWGWAVIALAVFVVFELPSWVAGMWAIPSLPIAIAMFELAVAVGTTLQLSWTFPGVITRVFRSRDRRGAVQLLKLSPASTPGLRFIADALAFGSSFLLACLVIAVLIGFLIRAGVSSVQGVQAGLPLLIAVIILLLIQFSIVPVGQLNWLIVETKVQTVREFDKVLQAERSGWIGGSTRAQSTTEQLGILLQSDNLPFKSSIVLQFAGVAVGAVVAYVVQALAR